MLFLLQLLLTVWALFFFGKAISSVSGLPVLGAFAAFYCSIISVIRPLTWFYFGYSLPLVSEAQINKFVWQFQLCALIFFAVAGATLIASAVLIRKTTISSFFDKVTLRRQKHLWLVCAIFLMVSYIINVGRYGSPLYLIDFQGDQSDFEIMQQGAGGAWYLNVLVGAAFFPISLYISAQLQRKLSGKIGIFRASVSILLAFAAYFIVVRPATRTALLAALLAILFISFGRRIGIKQVLWAIPAALGLLMLTSVLNFFRTGAFGSDMSIVETLGSSLIDFHQFETAIYLLENYASNPDWYYFKYFLGAITPLSLIPSALVPFRPDTNKDALLTEKLWAVTSDSTFFSENSTVTYTAFISGYPDFGYFGVAVAGMSFGLLCFFFCSAINKVHVSKLFFMVAFLNLIIGVRYSVEGALLTFWVFVMFSAAILGILGGVGRFFSIRRY